MILIASVSYSQITISNNQAKQAIKNARAIPLLESEIKTQGLIISNFEEIIVPNLNEQLSNLKTRLELSQDNVSIFKTRWESEKAKKNPKYSFEDFFLDLGKVAAGLLVGVLLVN